MIHDITAQAFAPELPLVIQGGMGIGVSNWRLAKTVSQAGQLGVVSGTAINTLLVRRLQQGDPLGHIRRALEACPLKKMARTVVEKYFVEGGLPSGKPYALLPMYTTRTTKDFEALTAVASFVEVFLAKEGHDRPVGINLLEKIQLPTLSTLYGAMLAGVDYVIMGAGIPKAIPGVLDAFSEGRPASLKIDISGPTPNHDIPVEPPTMTFDPKEISGEPVAPLRRPKFLAVVSSAVVALTMAKKASGRVDGFIVEGATAGGHNAPPRGGALNEHGEPAYGPRDEVDLKAIRALGRSFWLAGSFASAEKLADARAQGAQGVQIGTAFAFCRESGMRDDYKAAVIAHSLSHNASVFTDPQVSPTGLPFKVVKAPGTLSEPELFAARERRCDLGYLRQPYWREDGLVGYRCPAEPLADYVRKGGAPAETTGRKCLCNGLFATIGLGQRRNGGGEEPAIITGGTDVADLNRFLPPGETTYSAEDVLRHMGLIPG